MAILFSDVVKARSASALRTVKNGMTTYFLKLDRNERFVRVSREIYEQAEILMKGWDSLHCETDRNNVTRHYKSLRR